MVSILKFGLNLFGLDSNKESNKNVEIAEEAKYIKKITETDLINTVQSYILNLKLAPKTNFEENSKTIDGYKFEEIIELLDSSENADIVHNSFYLCYILGQCYLSINKYSLACSIFIYIIDNFPEVISYNGCAVLPEYYISSCVYNSDETRIKYGLLAVDKINKFPQELNFFTENVYTLLGNLYYCNQDYPKALQFYSKLSHRDKNISNKFIECLRMTEDWATFFVAKKVYDELENKGQHEKLYGVWNEKQNKNNVDAYLPIHLTNKLYSKNFPDIDTVINDCDEYGSYNTIFEDKLSGNSNQQSQIYEHMSFLARK